jgi:DNA-binding transcriptional LysR family regulator
VGRRLQLSPAGRDLAALARHQFAALQRFAEDQQQRERCWAVGAGNSVLQWWLMPALSSAEPVLHWSLENLRTNEVVARVADERLDFGIVREDALRDSLGGEAIGTIRYAIAIPKRMRRRTMPLKVALTELPHAALRGDGQLNDRLKLVAGNLGGTFQAKLSCDSLILCVAAVRTGRYAAVLPTHAMSDLGDSVDVIDSVELDVLARPMALIWNPRSIETLGASAGKARDTLIHALRAESRKWEGELAS